MTLVSEMELLPIDQIEATAATQVRVRLDKPTIETYKEDLDDGADMPPIVVFREENSERYILADGFHRLFAAVDLGWETIGCEVHAGGMKDALVFALGANSNHGLRRTNADKRHAVEMALKDPELGRLPRQEIADVCRVTKRTVQRIANQEAADGGDKVTPKKAEPKPPTDEDFRDNGAEVLQEDVDLAELRAACKTINTFPYAGEDALHLPMTQDDVADAEYASTWLANAVIAYRNQGEDDG